jgi:Rad3-related DNA helicase
MIGLTSTSKTDANLPYVEQKENTGKADILITSHAMVVIEAKIGRPILGLGEGVWKHIVFDEADQVASGASQLTNHRVQLLDVVRQLDELRSQGTTHLARKLTMFMKNIRHLNEIIKKLGEGKTDNEFILDGHEANKSELRPVVVEFQEECRAIANTLRRSSLAKTHGTDHGLTDDILRTLNWISGFMGDTRKTFFGANAVSWSPKLRIPSLMYMQPNPAAFMSALWRSLDLRVCFTSATLGKPDNGMSQNRFVSMKQDLAIAGKAIGVEVQLAPRSFGDLSFVLADPRAQRPVLSFDEEEGASLSPRWLNYTARMIEAASESGPTLVLTASYDEAVEIGMAMSGRRPIIHKRGTPLRKCVDALKLGESDVLITPAAWQGVSIRGENDDQFIQNLVISRIPFTPPDETEVRMTAHFIKTGFKKTGTKKRSIDARQIVALKHQEQTIIKLRQGFGRAIRKHSDIATVWIADPRFPAVGDRGRYQVYVKAVAPRFMSNYDKADRFFEKGVAPKPEKPLTPILKALSGVA